MYIPGRSRTGSSPLRTVMSLAAYATREHLADRSGAVRQALGFAAKPQVRAPELSVVSLPDDARETVSSCARISVPRAPQFAGPSRTRTSRTTPGPTNADARLTMVDSR